MHDWIIVGAGITGAALAYELVKKGFSVLLLEKDAVADNATRYSYGGLAYWSGTDEFTSQLCQEGINLHRQLSRELDADTEFRHIDLLLTAERETNPETINANYQQFAILPEILTVKEACELEPLLNSNAISGALKLPHAHIHPLKTTQAYQQAFQRLGGKIKIARVNKLLLNKNKIEGVSTDKKNYYANNTVICGGGLTRFLLSPLGINIPVYFTQAELIKTESVDIKLHTLVMPAVQQRFILENKASDPDLEPLWNNPSDRTIFSIVDAGAVQFQDGSICIGQISSIITNPEAGIDAKASEAKIRQKISTILTSLGEISGTWHRCLVAFTPKNIAVVGAIENYTGIYIFSGFTSTLLYAPPLARRFAERAV